ncbi:Ferroxidase [Periconia macrospinosa]|uniref:Ferroxidase n=1 Tax=Periconia macrospinosa TaxID=97972 RepID=A0A2V1DBY0_9PLEO|nr:Ferroxidase [Periconia macrospinosa]
MFPLVLLATLATFSLAKTVRYDFDIGWVTAAPDGFARPVQAVNGQWPLPIIEANVNDTIIVKIHNSLGNESTSLHFHAQYQFGTGTADGPVGVTQCPVYPGQSYTYKFKAWPPGTHWYHSHAEGAYPDGLRGKMIIHDPDWEASLKIDKQIPLSMSDWYHRQMPSLLDEYLGVENRNGNIPIPDAFLFNDTTKAPEFVFEPLKRYLLRIVNMAALTCGTFHLENHNLTVVAIDGRPVVPKNASTILLCAGQRYDAIVVGQNAPNTSTQYIAKMEKDMLTNGTAPPDEKLSVIGGISYKRNGTSVPINPQFTKLLGPWWNPSKVLDDTTLIPRDREPLLKGVTKRINWSTKQVYYEGIGTRIAVGEQPWTEPKVPSLLTALSTGKSALEPSTYGKGVAPEITRLNDIVEIYMENSQPWPHPMHLHGHTFQIAGRGAGTWNGDESVLYPIPAKRDTVVIPPEGYIVLRYRANNPGAWFFHCHIDFHVAGGMAAVIIEAPDVLQKQQSLSAQTISTCKTSHECPLGNCACRTGGISVEDSDRECNTIFNSHGMTNGSLITWGSNNNTNANNNTSPSYHRT